MGKSQENQSEEAPASPPELVRRRENRKSMLFRSGRTIGEKRERLETRNERMAARKKQKHQKTFRIIFTILGFLILGFILVYLYLTFSKSDNSPITLEDDSEKISPTIEIIDEEASSGGQITSRMNTYIARAEKEFKALNYQPTKAVVPVNSIREVDLYLENYEGFIRMTIDRNPATSVEDADRMLRYLSGIGVDNFSYIDVRIEGKAYWK